jgi:hypothetical protein
MPKFVVALAAAFLAGITLGLAGCSQVTDLRKALVENSRPVGVQSADVWTHAADRGGAE